MKQKLKKDCYRVIFITIIAALLLGQSIIAPADSQISVKAFTQQAAQQAIAGAPATADAANFFSQIRRDRQGLRKFLRRMPKGGELHSHLSGTPTPDRLLELAAGSTLFQYYVRIPQQPASDDPIAYKLYAVLPGKTLEPENGAIYLPVSALLKADNETTRAQREAFRRANQINEGEANPLDIFYGAIFHRREQIVNSSEMVPLLIEDAVKQAHHDGLSYLELQINPFPVSPMSNAVEVNRAINLTSAREYLATLNAAVQQANEPLPVAERVEVRFILAFSRTNNKVFLYLPIAFELAAGNDPIANLIAGINLVGNEYSQDQRIGQSIAGPEHLSDYLITLHRVYPRVRITLHAGEGTRWDWHIRDSILMGAERIGHATNLMLSPDAIEPELLRRNRILVEACLTSNHLLLGVPLAEHPFIKYLRAGIPVSLNSDDAGIFSTNMNEEFARVAENYPDLSWEELKRLARNSLEHSFLSEEQKAKIIAKWETDIKNFESTKDWQRWLAAEK